MPLEVARIRALCFDVDGTLSDTDDQFVQRLVRLLKPVRFLFPQRDPLRFARWAVMRTESPGNLAYTLADKLHIDNALARLGDMIYNLGLGRESRPFQLIPGVAEMLAQLQPRYPMAVVSARGRRSTLRFIAQFNLGGFFAWVATGQTCKHTKPHADPILWAAARLGVDPANCLMIGDTTVDILAAKAAGCQSLGVLCGFGEEAELRAAGADEIVSSTAQLPQILA